MAKKKVRYRWYLERPDGHRIALIYYIPPDAPLGQLMQEFPIEDQSKALYLTCYCSGTYEGKEFERTEYRYKKENGRWRPDNSATLAKYIRENSLISEIDFSWTITE